MTDAPTRILLLRHAESADPTVFHGAESDVGLSPRGVRQARAVAPFVASLAPEVLISSGMLRARQTAAPIAEACGLSLLIEPDLHERKVGVLSGTATSAPDGVYTDTIRRWMAGDTGYAPEGAESLGAVRDRVLPVWQRIAETHAGKTVAVVAHGMVCKTLLFSLLPGYDLATWQRFGPIRNVALHELVWEDGVWRAERINYLPPDVFSL